ncbi:MAG: hypothetical protein K2K75_09240 [Muribaculaceae bacterium]|nr:hypothetical protein [Muribaculaceae bacterium]
MNYELILLSLPSGSAIEPSRKCHISAELYQNARLTMGELRDLMRQTGISWDFIQHQIDLANHPQTPIDKALRHLDPYTTGLGHSLQDLPSNVW